MTSWLRDEMRAAVSRMTYEVIDALKASGVPESVFMRADTIGIAKIKRVRWLPGRFLPHPAGRPAIIVADGIPNDGIGWDQITELVAISLKDRSRYLVREGSSMLGEHTRKPHATVYCTPWEWLCADDGGVCLL